MSISRQNLSIVIVTLKSEKVIYDCINSINANIPIIIVENSNNKKFKTDIESKYSNVRCILTNSNLGMGEKAMVYAKETLHLTEKHNFKDFDLGYAFEAMARTHAALKNMDECQKWLIKAMKGRGLIEGSEDKKIYFRDLENGP